MITDRELTQVVRSWLDDGVTRLPDRVLDAVIDQLPANGQRRRVAGIARTPRRLAFLGIAAAVVVAVGLTSRSLLPAIAPGAGASQVLTPSPSPLITPAPLVPTSPRPVPVNGAVAGTYFIDTLNGASLRSTFTVPEGWSSCCGGGWIHKALSEPPQGVGFTVWAVTNVYPDPCNRQGGPMDPPLGPTVDELVAAIQAQPDRRPTTPRPVTISGFDGVELEWSVPSGQDVTACTFGQYVSWSDRDPSGQRYHQGPDQIDHLWILDVDGTRLVIMTTFYSATNAADRAELDAIVTSIDVVVRTPPASPPAPQLSASGGTRPAQAAPSASP